MRNSKNLDIGYVYFIQISSDGPIKIGYSKHKSAKNRLIDAQTYSSEILRLICVTPGGRRKERELHKEFHEFNIMGEWFVPNDKLSKLINEQKYIGLTTNDFVKKKSKPFVTNNKNKKQPRKCIICGCLTTKIIKNRCINCYSYFKRNKTDKIVNKNTGFIYFIQMQCNNGPIKIGYSIHQSIEGRLSTAQVYNPTLLKLICIMPGNRQKEKELHKYFCKFNIRGEWFTPNEELYNLIKLQKYLGLTVNDFRRSTPSLSNSSLWKGDAATDFSKRNRIAKKYKIPPNYKCDICKTKYAIERTCRDHNKNNMSPENILLVCRHCCMELDGRMEKFKTVDKEYLKKPPRECIICKGLSKIFRKGRCHACNEYYRRNGRERNEFLNRGPKKPRNCINCNKATLKLCKGRCHTCDAFIRRNGFERNKFIKDS